MSLNGNFKYGCVEVQENRYANEKTIEDTKLLCVFPA